MDLEFEWDTEKAESNLRKHRVPFFKAALVFEDPARQLRPDDSDDFEKERWSVLGFVEPYVLFVAFTHREERVRWISAREATRNEQQHYWAGYISS